MHAYITIHVMHILINHGVQKGPYIFKQMVSIHLASCYMYLHGSRVELDEKIIIIGTYRTFEQ